jgi:hypothetical protein
MCCLPSPKTTGGLLCTSRSRASLCARCAPSPSRVPWVPPKPPASPNDDASVLHLRPPVRSQSIGVRSSEQLRSLGRQPTCQCARQFPHHAETPPSVRGPLNLPCHRNRRQGLIKRKIEVSYQLDSIRNGRRLDARRARLIAYSIAPGSARNYSSAASGVEEPVPTRIVFSEAP